MADRVGGPIAAGAVLATIGASSIAYYVLVLPTMAHGVAFGVAGIAVWAWDRAARSPSLSAWVVLGAACGLLSLVRWQAVLFGILPLLLGVDQIRRSTARLAWVAAGAAAALAFFAPQAAVWHILYGQAVTIPQGAGFVDWTSPHFRDVLLSADHGLFTWTPIALVGVIGLLVLIPASPTLAIGGLLVCFATAWVSGGVRDWAASDAFGARRFDFVMPLVAVGVAELTRRACQLLRAKPALGPLILGALLVLWNLGFVRGFGHGEFPRAAPLEKLAASQARNVTDGLEWVFSRVAGTAGRAIAYGITVGEYFYTNINPSGGIEVGAVNSPYLLEGWSKTRFREGWPQFRWAHSPQACARVPLRRPFALRGTVTARALPGRGSTDMSITMNGTVLSTVGLDDQWASYSFLAPENTLVEGENRLCLLFPNVGAGDPPQASAAVSLIQLP